MWIEELDYLTQNLSNRGVMSESWLTDNEISQIESKFNIVFPTDLRLFLANSLPISQGFINWRLGLSAVEIEKEINERLQRPLEGLLFDVKNNDFRFEEWGVKPTDKNEQISLIKKKFETYPILIPIYSHRYISSLPNEIDNPVFSVHQTDIIYYWFNLIDYFAKEFEFTLSSNIQIPEKPKNIEFWSEIVE